MKVEVRLSDKLEEPYAVIYTDAITPQIRRVAALIDGENAEGVIPVMENGRIFVLRPDEIYMIRVENDRTAVYAESKRYSSGKRLYEFEACLGCGFMRISKSAIVNLKHIDCVEPTLGGLMLLILKNGCKDYISRRYLPSFKKYLGL